MKYVQLRKSDYDKSLRLNDQLCLCYSAKKIKEIESENVEILGEVIKGTSKKEPMAKLSVESKSISVYENGTFNKLFHKKAGYIAVEDSDGYIAVLENRLPLFIWIFSLTVIAVVAVMAFHSPSSEAVDPYNALPPVDSNVEMLDIGDQESTAPEGGGKVGIGYDQVAELNLQTKEIEMEYLNPGVSNHDAVIELYITSEGKEYRIAASGRLPRGSKLKKMALSEDAPNLSQGIYDALYKVSYYDAQTGEKALVSSDINDIQLVVKNK